MKPCEALAQPCEALRSLAKRQEEGEGEKTKEDCEGGRRNLGSIEGARIWQSKELATSIGGKYDFSRVFLSDSRIRELEWIGLKNQGSNG